MITMEMLGKIRRMYLRDRLSLHEIAKRTGLSRNTLRRWLREPEAVHETAVGSKPWVEVLADRKELGNKVSKVKKRLNRDAADRMTLVRLAHSDDVGELSSWLTRIHAMLD